MSEFKTGDYAMVRVGKTPTDSPDLAWLIFENGLLAGSVASTALSPLPPPATEAERRLVEAAIAHTRGNAPSSYRKLMDAAEAVLAERKPPDPVAEVLAAWRQIADAGNVGEYQDRMGRMDRAINALAASRSDKT